MILLFTTRACKLYTDDHYQTAKKNALPFVRNSELCMCYKNFVLTRHFSTVLAFERSRPSTPRITHRARANWLVSPPILSSAPEVSSPMIQTSFQRHKITTSRKIHVQKLSQADWFVNRSHSDCFHETFMIKPRITVMFTLRLDKLKSTVHVMNSQRVTIHLPQKRFPHNGI